MDRPNNQNYYAILLVFVLCLTPAIAAYAPRTLGYIPSVLGLISLMAFRPVFGYWPAVPRIYAALAGALVVLMGLSILWAIDPEIASERTFKIFLLLLGSGLLLSVIQALPQQALAPFLKYYPPVLILCGIALIAEHYTGGMIYKKFIEDPTALDQYNASKYNRSTVFFVLNIPLAWLCLRQNHQTVMSKVWLTMLASVSAALVMITQSQTAQIVVLIFIVIVLSNPIKAKWHWRAITVILFTGLLSAPWAVQFMYAYIPPLAVEAGGWFEHSYMAPRLEIWHFIAKRILENPLYGFGVEATRAIEDFESRKVFYKSNTILHPHNFALQLWIEFGVLGVAYGTVFFAVILEKLKSLNVSCKRTFTALFLGLVAAAATSYGLWQGWWVGLFNLLLIECAIVLKFYSAKTATP